MKSSSEEHKGAHGGGAKGKVRPAAAVGAATGAVARHVRTLFSSRVRCAVFLAGETALPRSPDRSFFLDVWH